MPSSRLERNGGVDPAILVADDDRDVCEIVVEEFERIGYQGVRTATSVSDALSVVRASQVDLAIIDVNFTPEGREGIELIAQIHRECPDTFIVVLSVVDNPEDIVDAIRGGAQDYITKDAPHLDLSTQLGSAIRHCVSRIEEKHLPEVEKRLLVRHRAVLVGDSENLRDIRTAVSRAHANRLERFLVVGDSGTGKRAVADYIMESDPRGAGEPVASLTFNCGATTLELARSELFGIAAHSGLPNVSSRGKPGAFTLARGGYLIIDDFQDLPEALYPAFLQVLERSEVKPIGGPGSERVELRLIVTTQRPLEAFPAQLRRRLQMEAEVLSLLPLDKRREDILPLARHYLEKLHAEGRLPRPLALCTDVERALVRRQYPANVGDLEYLLFRLAMHESSSEISAETFARIALESVFLEDDCVGALAESERRSIRSAVDAAFGDVKRAAEVLGLDHQALRRRAAKYGIEVGRRWRADGQRSL